MRYAFIEAHRDEFAIHRMCRVLRVSRSGYYDWRCRKPSMRALENATLSEVLLDIHQKSRETYGGRKLWRELLARGYRCGRHRAERLRRACGLESRRRKRFKRAYEAKKTAPPAPNLLNQCFVAHKPDQIWVGDITFIPTRSGWLYLAVLLDLFSRKVIGWSMDKRPSSELILNALEMAVQRRNPEPGMLHHSDQGSQYTSTRYQDRLIELGATISMSRKGNCFDNAVAESFFSTLKAELVHHRNFRNSEEARSEIFEFIEVFYNRQRLHQNLDYHTPVQYERIMKVA